MEIDYAGDPLVWVDEDAAVHRDRVFVAALPFSGLIFAQVYESERQEFWVQGVIEALEEALQKLPLPSRMEQKCSVRLFLTTPECAVFFANTIVKY